MKRLKIDAITSSLNLRVLTKSLVGSKFFGNYRSVFKGRGLEFEGYREYTYQDDASLIDWKATIRSKKTLIREFVEERDLNIFFLIDGSSSMLLGSIPKLKSEYAAELVTVLSHAILESGDNVGFALFTDKVVKSVSPDRGAKQFYVLTETLVDPDLYGGSFDLEEAIKFLIGFLKVHSLVFIVSDFITSDSEKWLPYFEMASKKFQMIGIRIRDPIDEALPDVKGRVIVSDPFSDKAVIIEPNLIKDDYAKDVREEEKRLIEIFEKNNSDFFKLRTDQEFMGPLTKFFKMREARSR